MPENGNQKSGFTEFLLGVIVAVALFLIWKKEHALLTSSNGNGTQPFIPSPVASVSASDGCGDTCTNCGVQNIPVVTNPILATQISPTVAGSFPSVVPTVPRAPVNTLRIGVQYVSPPRAATTTANAVGQAGFFPTRTSPVPVINSATPSRLGPSLV